MLADKGIIEYDGPVSDCWPEFGNHGKDKVTVAVAMSHRTVVYIPPSKQDFDIGDWEAGIKYVEDAVPSFTPGTKRGYQGRSFSWIVGGIIEKASGLHIKDVICDWIAKPLGVARAGGSQGYADPDIGLSIAVTLNKKEIPRDRTIEIYVLIRNELGFE